MTMLNEICKNEPAGTAMFGPACASGPLGGDAELVALMVGGRIGGHLVLLRYHERPPTPIEPTLIA